MAYIGAFSVNTLSADFVFGALLVDFVGSLSEDGIKFSYDEDVATMTKGLHGSSVHNIGISTSGTFTASLLAGSPADLKLNNIHDLMSSGALHPVACNGSVRDGLAKVTYLFSGISIKTVPERAFGKEIGKREWVFQYSNSVSQGGI